jgi:prepilin-type processing-associated H-X9-DG protein
MLVVIAIITVIIAILLPALAKAREAAVAVQCLSNLRQCGLSFTMYAADNHDFIFMHYRNNWNPTGWVGYYTGAPLPYIYSTKITYCTKMGPAHGSYGMVSQNAFTDVNTHPTGLLSTNDGQYYIPGPWNNGANGTWLLWMTKVTYPRTSYAVLMDSACENVGVTASQMSSGLVVPPDQGGSPLVNPAQTWSGGQIRGAWLCHPTNRGNVLFADWHAESCDKSMLKEANNPGGFHGWWDQDGAPGKQ